MARLNFSNNAVSALAADITFDATTLQVDDPTPFPTPPFRITIGAEIIEIDEVVTDTFSVAVRGAESTTPAAHLEDAVVELRWTAGAANELVSQTEFDASIDSLVSSAAKNYYLDWTSGDDDNSGEAVGTAVKTWARILELLPDTINHPHVVYIVGNYPGDILVASFAAADREYLVIRGYTAVAAAHAVNAIEVTNCRGGTLDGILFQYLQLDQTAIMGSCQGVKFSDVIFNASGVPGIMIYTSITTIRDYDIGTDVCQDGIWAHSSIVYSRNGTGNALNTGLRAMYGTTIAMHLTQPTGTVNNTLATAAQIIS